MYHDEEDKIEQKELIAFSWIYFGIKYFTIIDQFSKKETNWVRLCSWSSLRINGIL